MKLSLVHGRAEGGARERELREEFWQELREKHTRRSLLVTWISLIWGNWENLNVKQLLLDRVLESSR